MPVEYAWSAKAARMEAVRVLLDGGHLVLLADDGVTRLGDIALDTPSGGVISGLFVLSGFPKFCEVLRNGELKRAALYGPRGDLVGGGLTVGKERTDDIVVNETQVTAGNLIKIDAAELRHA